jgi:hypothetical protein
VSEEIPDNVSSSFQQLKAVAAELNAVSGELGKTITTLDAALQLLNLGISTWVRITGAINEENGDFWAREIGYAKVGPRWGISLRTREGNARDHDEVIEKWLFSDAPRPLRIEAVDMLPALLEGLIKEATSTVEKIKGQIGYAQQVVAAIGGPPAPPKLQSAPTAREQAAALRAGRPEPPEVSKAHPPIRPLKGNPYPPTRK